LGRFAALVGDDLNVPRGLALAWDLTKAEVDEPVKKATMLAYDKVLGLRLGEWEPASVPADIVDLARRRQSAREARDWATADALRDEIEASGYEVRDTPEGPDVRKTR
jgi:cysteinyl-tRNA synthetase